MVDVNNSDGINRTRSQVVIADLDDDERPMFNAGRLDADEVTTTHIIDSMGRRP